MEFQTKSLLSKFPKHHILYKENFHGMDLTIRLADYDDFHHVMAISENIYNGLDYIPAKYNWFLDTGKALAFLAFVGAAPVGFQMCYVFDPKQPCLGLAARLLPSYRSKHIFLHFSVTVENFVAEEVVEMKRFLSVGAMTEGRRHFLAKLGIAPFLSWNALFFQLNIDQIRIMPQDQGRTYKVTSQELETIFNNKNNLKVFKSTRFAADKPKIPYEVTKGNILAISNHNLVFVSTREGHKCDCIDAISFASSMYVPRGLMFEIFYYGIDHLEVFKSHIKQALLALTENNTNTKKTVILGLYFEPDFSLDIVERFIHDTKMGTRVDRTSATVINVLEYGFGDNSWASNL